MTIEEIENAGGILIYDFGSQLIYQIPIHVAYYDSLGIPKDKDGWDITRSYKTVIIKKDKNENTI